MIEGVIYTTNKFNKSMISGIILPLKKEVIIVQIIILSVALILSNILEKHEATEIGL